MTLYEVAGITGSTPPARLNAHDRGVVAVDGVGPVEISFDGLNIVKLTAADDG